MDDGLSIKTVSTGPISAPSLPTQEPAVREGTEAGHTYSTQAVGNSQTEQEVGNKALEKSSAEASASHEAPQVKNEVPNSREAAKTEKQYVSQKDSHVVTFYTSDKRGSALYKIREFGQLVYDKVLGQGTFGMAVAIKGIKLSSFQLSKASFFQRCLGVFTVSKPEAAEEIAVKAALNEDARMDAHAEKSVLQRVNNYNRALLGGAEGIQPAHQGVIQDESSSDLVQTKMAGDLAKVPVKDKSRMVSQLIQAGWVYMTTGLVHVDIKPGNIFVDSNQNCYVADHGGACFMKSNYRAGDLDGLAFTPPYTDIDSYNQMANAKTPEEARVCSNRVMSFQLGVSMYENIVGGLPYSLNAHPDYKAVPDLPTDPRAIKQWKKDRTQELVANGCKLEDAQIIVALMDPDPNTRLTGTDLSKHLPPEVKIYQKGVALYEQITGRADAYVNYNSRKEWANEKKVELMYAGKTPEEADEIVKKLAKGDEKAIGDYEKLVNRKFEPFKTYKDLTKELEDKGCTPEDAQFIVRMMNSDPKKRPSAQEMKARAQVPFMINGQEVQSANFGKYTQKQLVNLKRDETAMKKPPVPPPSTPPPGAAMRPSSTPPPPSATPPKPANVPPPPSTPPPKST